jgi:hypothetical protein
VRSYPRCRRLGVRRWKRRYRLRRSITHDFGWYNRICAQCICISYGDMSSGDTQFFDFFKSLRWWSLKQHTVSAPSPNPHNKSGKHIV